MRKFWDHFDQKLAKWSIISEILTNFCPWQNLSETRHRIRCLSFVAPPKAGLIITRFHRTHFLRPSSFSIFVKFVYENFGIRLENRFPHHKVVKSRDLVRRGGSSIKRRPQKVPPGAATDYGVAAVRDLRPLVHVGA